LFVDLGVGARRQLQGGEGVPQVVEVDRRQAGVAQQRLELPGRDVASPQRLAGVIAEDEVVLSGNTSRSGRQYHAGIARVSANVTAIGLEVF